MKVNQSFHARAYHQGFTLVELLIAMSILLLVLFIGSFAYKQYSQFWNKEIGTFEANLGQAKSVSLLYNVIRNIRPHMIRGGNNVWYHYFEGGNTLIRSVTAKSISNPDFAAIFELKVEQDTDKSRLVYREKVIDKAPFLNASQITGYTFEQTLDIEFESILIEYKGWSHADDFYEHQEKPNEIQQSWFGFYSGQDTLVTPSQLKITIVGLEADSQLLIPLMHFVPEQLEFYSQGTDG